MPATNFNLEFPARRTSAWLSASLAAIALATASPAAAQDLSGVNVTARAPTSVTLKVGGMDISTVKREVRDAARLVCRNAVANDELTFFDLSWCADATRAKAMVTYRAALKGVDPSGALRAEGPILTLLAAK